MVRLSIRAVSAFLACIGLVVWTYYAFEGFYRVNPTYYSPETDWSVLVFKTYFCTPRESVHRYQVKCLCIFQLFIYTILLVGLFKVDRLPVFLSWSLLVILQLRRVQTIVYSGCPWNYRVVLHLLYASFEIWIVLMSMMQKNRKTQESYDQSPPHERQLNPREIQSNVHMNINAETIPELVNPVAYAPTLTDGNSITNSCHSDVNSVSSSTADLPPTYDDSVGSPLHRSTNFDYTYRHSSNGNSLSDISYNLPPSYQDCVSFIPQYNLHR